jgi:hypothetical protein
MCIIREIDWCVLDSVECYHNCKGCKWGFIVCSGCGNIVEWDDAICLECGMRKKHEKANS